MSGKRNVDRITILEALEDWPLAIQLGIFRPEMVQPIPLHRMCVLDTCILGYTPKIFWQSIDKWTGMASENSRNKSFIKDIKKNTKLSDEDAAVIAASKVNHINSANILYPGNINIYYPPFVFTRLIKYSIH